MPVIASRVPVGAMRRIGSPVESRRIAVGIAPTRVASGPARGKMTGRGKMSAAAGMTAARSRVPAAAEMTATAATRVTAASAVTPASSECGAWSHHSGDCQNEWEYLPSGHLSCVLSHEI